MRFSVALLGCGAVVQDFYLPILKSLDRELDVRLCLDLDPRNSQSVASALGATVVTGGLEQLLEQPPTDGVIISIPNTLHAQAIVACLEASRHVFCEKPVAIHSSECEQIASALSRTDRTLSVNLVRRCLPATSAMGHVLQSGILGTLKRIEVTEGGRGGWNSRSGFQFVRGSAGGGVTLDRGSHIFDLLVNWLGPASVTAYTDDASGGTESTGVAKLQWPDGLEAIVKMSKCEPWQHRVTAEGTRGIARWSPAEPGWATVTSVAPSGASFDSVVTPSGVNGQASIGEALASILRLWVGACRGANPNPTPFAEIRQSIDLITACYENRHPLEIEWLAFQE